MPRPRGPLPSLARAAALAALGLATVGCETAANAYCDVFSATEMCCRRLPDHLWNPTTRTCEIVFLGS